MTGADPNADAKRIADMIRSIGRAPTSFRAFVELTARNWAEGVLEVVTPDGKRLIAVNNDAVVRVYDTATWAEATGYEWQIGQLTAVAVAPDGLRAACGSDRGRVVVWDLE